MVPGHKDIKLGKQSSYKKSQRKCWVKLLQLFNLETAHGGEDGGVHSMKQYIVGKEEPYKAFRFTQKESKRFL
jgi:hypothetical protein